MIKAGITAVGAGIPETVLTNFDLEKMMDTTDEWIRTRTGIQERRILTDKNLAASDLGVEAIRKILNDKNIAPEEIDLVIVATVTGDHSFPDTGNIICDKLGLKNAFGFDIHAACSGFLYALTVGTKFIETSTYKKVIVVGVDIMSRIIDYTDRTTSVIFGDAAGAVLLEPIQDGTGILDSYLRGDGSGRHHLYMKAGGSMHPTSSQTVENKEHFIYQDGKIVFKYAVNGMISAIKEVAERNHLTLDEINWIVPHQANMRIITSVAEHLNYPIEKTMINIQRYGNTTSGTIPLCLYEWQNQLKKGDKVILTAFGGGFTWGAIYVNWSI